MQSHIESALNPLTISVNASSLDESVLSHEGTPVKKDNIESQTCYTNTSGLLAYSTPVLQNRYKFISTPNAFAMPVLYVGSVKELLHSSNLNKIVSSY